MSPVDNKLALVQVMASRSTGEQPLPEPMMPQLTNTYMRHSGVEGWCGDELKAI